MPGKKRLNRPYPSQRYGVAHKTMRKRLARVVEAGKAICARCVNRSSPARNGSSTIATTGAVAWSLSSFV
jgi:hypothetical protein